MAKAGVSRVGKAVRAFPGARHAHGRCVLRALNRAELPRVRVHDLRHTAATILLQRGVHPKVVQDLLGHSTIALTLDTYSHVMPALHAEVAEHMDAVFGS